MTLFASSRKAGASSGSVGLSDAAALAAVAAVVGLFLLSPVTLEAHGVAYLTSGGGVLSKFHPSTFLAIAALGLRCLAARRPVATAWRLVSSDPGVVLLLVAVGIAGFCAVAIDKTPVTPLIDTFVLPCLIFVLLRDLNPALVRTLALLITLILCANAAIALFEFLDHTHLVQIDVPEGASPDPTRAGFDWRMQLYLDWRATALLGHPLANGLIVGCFIVCLAAAGSNWLPATIKLPLIALQFVSMFAFGARTALALTVLIGAWLGLRQAIEALGGGGRLRPRDLAVTCIIVIALIGAIAILADSGFADRTIERFSDDQGSATTRITMFNLFQPLSWFDMLFSPDKEVVDTWQHLEGLEFGIESSWVGLALIYGMVVMGILLAGTLALARSVVRASGRGAIPVLFIYLVLASVSATMSGKTTSYAVIISLIMVFLHDDERRVPLRAATFLPWSERW